jgi:hypothetical protein
MIKYANISKNFSSPYSMKLIMIVFSHPVELNAAIKNQLPPKKQYFPRVKGEWYRYPCIDSSTPDNDCENKSETKMCKFYFETNYFE